MSWQHVMQCKECGMICEYEQTTLPIICVGCGNQEFNQGIGRRFGAKHWEIMPERFQAPLIESSNAIHVDRQGNHLEPADLVITADHTHKLVRQADKQNR